MTEKISQTLYGGEVIVDFFPNSHAYKINGNRVPFSVTGITGIVDKSAPLMGWAVNCMRDRLLADMQNGMLTEQNIREACGAYRDKKQEAADIGTMVHDFCEQFARHQLGELLVKPTLPTDEKAVAGCLAFLRWVEDQEVRFVGVEQICYSRTHQYSGKFDAEYTTKETRAIDPSLIRLGDYKTAKGFYPLEMGMQTAAYQNAKEEELGKRYHGRDILRFDKESGEFEVHPCINFESDRDAFLAALALKRRQKELDQLYPKDWSKK